MLAMIEVQHASAVVRLIVDELTCYEPNIATAIRTESTPFVSDQVAKDTVLDQYTSNIKPRGTKQRSWRLRFRNLVIGIPPEGETIESKRPMRNDRVFNPAIGTSSNYGGMGVRIPLRTASFSASESSIETQTLADMKGRAMLVYIVLRAIGPLGDPYLLAALCVGKRVLKTAISVFPTAAIIITLGIMIDIDNWGTGIGFHKDRRLRFLVLVANRP